MREVGNPMRRKISISAALCLWLRPVFAACAADPSSLTWRAHKPGLEVGEQTVPGSLRILRIDPALWEFSLHMASEQGGSLSLGEWARRQGLEAGINASMYLPDNKTSIGYMRGPGHVNNSRKGGRLGAFFAAEPESAASPDIPAAAIYERETPDLEQRLSAYSVVVQNYRLIDGSGKILWASGGPLHSIAAVAEDASGRILFILAADPMPSADFAALLQRSNLSLKAVMYVEGGMQAGIFLRENGPDAPATVWRGRQPLLKLEGDVPLPNILGIRPRKAK